MSSVLTFNKNNNNCCDIPVRKVAKKKKQSEGVRFC